LSKKLTVNEQKRLIETALHISGQYHSLASSLIPVLQRIQALIGYIPKQAFRQVSATLKIPISQIYGVVTFYHQFRLQPEKKHRITLCKGTACHVGGADINHLVLKRYLNLQAIGDIAEDSVFTVSEVRCLGACSLAPILKVNNDIYGNVNPTLISKILAKYRKA
jgi:NADH:ubiquinone oxidoreductase subunit E